MSNKLLTTKCIPCEVGGLPLTGEEIIPYLNDLPEWKLSGDIVKISRLFEFENFKSALAFVDKVGKLAEEEGHHPDIFIHYNQVTLELWTHEVGGLSENDFIMAAKVGLIK